MNDTILSITDDALRMIREIRDAESGDDEFALLVAEQVAIAVPDQEGVPPSALTGGFEGLPDSPAASGVEAAQLSVAAHAVDMIARQNRRADDRGDDRRLRPSLRGGTRSFSSGAGDAGNRGG